MTDRQPDAPLPRQDWAAYFRLRAEDGGGLHVSKTEREQIAAWLSEPLPTRDAVRGDSLELAAEVAEHHGAEKAAAAIRALKTAPQGTVSAMETTASRVAPADAAPTQAHSKSEYKRLSAQGADVLPPAPAAKGNAIIAQWLREVSKRWYECKAYDQAEKALQAADALERTDKRSGG